MPNSAAAGAGNIGITAVHSTLSRDGSETVRQNLVGEVFEALDRGDRRPNDVHVIGVGNNLCLWMRDFLHGSHESEAGKERTKSISLLDSCGRVNGGCVGSGAANKDARGAAICTTEEEHETWGVQRHSK